MQTDRWVRIEQLCQEALELPAEQQSSFLDSACNSDVELRREIESLLAHRQGADTFLEAGAMDAAAQVLASADSASASRWIGRLIPPYRIVAKVASGGMGDVYRAERADGTFEKQVAIKLIQGARSTDFFLARFQNERQILASLDHPNIARLLDGGTTEEGLPYLVMELIEGLPIDLFCAKNKLDVPARLALFRTVCSAVQVAHQNLVVHRDLKPSNILVNSGGVPKLLDFGIAKNLNPLDREEFSQQTLTVMRMLTPDYASPEQVRNEPISTASDVYSLGVILYVLLTGQSPYRVRTDSPQEMLKAICDTEPEKPSTACTRDSATEGVGANSQQSPKLLAEKGSRNKLQKILEGDLDNIVLKALRKEPGRRYSSVEQFSEDILRHLTGLPVLAHKDTPGYRARKFVGRHRWGVAAAVLLLLSLAGGMIATLWQARIARAERARAERRFNDVRALAGSLIFEVHDAIVPLQGNTSARKLILERAQQYLDSLALEAHNDPDLLRELAEAYGRLGSVMGDARDANLGNRAKGVENEKKSVDLLKAAVALRPRDPKLQLELARAYLNFSVLVQLDPNQENAALSEAKAILEPLAANPQDRQAQLSLAKFQELEAGLLINDKDPNLALQAYEKSLVLYDNLYKTDPGNEEYQREVSFAHKHVGGQLSQMNRLDQASEHYRQALAIDEAQLAAHPDNINARFFITYTYSDTGLIFKKRGDLDRALIYYKKALEIRSAMLAADPKDTRAQWGVASTAAYISDILREKHDYPGALASAKSSLALRESLARGNPGDGNLSIKLAETQGLLAQIFVEMSQAKGLPPIQKIGYCRESFKWYAPSTAIYLRLQKEGKLPTNAMNDLAEVQKNQRPCSAH